jgi:transporter family protein
MHNWFLLTMVSLAFFGLTGITQKVSTNNISFEMSFIYFAIADTVVSLFVIAFEPLSWRTLQPGALALAALGGLLNGLGALTSFAALEKGGKASVVIPIINLFPIITVVGAWLFMGEGLTGRQMWGLALAFGSVVLLSRETPPDQLQARAN